LATNHWKVKLSKCSFAQNQIAYLGHAISQEGVATDPDKIFAISAWPVPQNVKELRCFLGLAGYYRKIVKHFGIITQPLTNLLKKHPLYIWTKDHEMAFQTLDQSLVAALVLALPKFSRPFILETNACDQGIGAVLAQHGHPLAFFSRALGPKSRAHNPPRKSRGLSPKILPEDSRRIENAQTHT
jgi:hypothetical protein